MWWVLSNDSRIFCPQHLNIKQTQREIKKSLQTLKDDVISSLSLDFEGVLRKYSDTTNRPSNRGEEISQPGSIEDIVSQEDHTLVQRRPYTDDHEIAQAQVQPLSHYRATEHEEYQHAAFDTSKLDSLNKYEVLPQISENQSLRANTILSSIPVPGVVPDGQREEKTHHINWVESTMPQLQPSYTDFHPHIESFSSTSLKSDSKAIGAVVDKNLVEKDEVKDPHTPSYVTNRSNRFRRASGSFSPEMMTDDDYNGFAKDSEPKQFTKLEKFFEGKLKLRSFPHRKKSSFDNEESEYSKISTGFSTPKQMESVQEDMHPRARFKRAITAVKKKEQLKADYASYKEESRSHSTPKKGVSTHKRASSKLARGSKSVKDEADIFELHTQEGKATPESTSTEKRKGSLLANFRRAANVVKASIRLKVKGRMKLDGRHAPVHAIENHKVPSQLLNTSEKRFSDMAHKVMARNRLIQIKESAHGESHLVGPLHNNDASKKQHIVKRLGGRKMYVPTSNKFENKDMSHALMEYGMSINRTKVDDKTDRQRKKTPVAKSMKIPHLKKGRPVLQMVKV